LHSQHQEMFLLLDNRDITGVQDNVLAEINWCEIFLKVEEAKVRSGQHFCNL
jgi:hypothetical protein